MWRGNIDPTLLPTEPAAWTRWTRGSSRPGSPRPMTAWSPLTPRDESSCTIQRRAGSPDWPPPRRCGVPGATSFSSIPRSAISSGWPRPPAAPPPRSPACSAPRGISARPKRWPIPGPTPRGRTGILILIRDLTALCREPYRAGRAGGVRQHGGRRSRDGRTLRPGGGGRAERRAVVMEGEAGVGQGAGGPGDPRPQPPVGAAAHRGGLRCGGAVAAGGRVVRPVPARRPWHTRVGRVELAHSGTLFLKRVRRHRRRAAPPDPADGGRGGGARGEATPRRVDVRVLACTAARSISKSGKAVFGTICCDACGSCGSASRRSGSAGATSASHRAPAGAARCGPAASHPLGERRAGGGEWPGNVRQLERVVRHLAAGSTSGADALIEPRTCRRRCGGAVPAAADPAPIPEDRRTMLLRALSSHGGNRTAAARALGIGRATFYRWWREEGLGGPDAPVHDPHQGSMTRSRSGVASCRPVIGRMPRRV